MNYKTIYYKKQTDLINQIKEEFSFQEIKKDSILNKLSFRKKEFADIYFHSGILDDDSNENIKNSKLTIVNSKALKKEILKESDIENDRIKVIYPSVKTNFDKTKEAKSRVCEKLDLQKNRKIIFFNAKNIKKSGVKEFIETVFSLNEQNFYAIITGDSKQIYNLKFQLTKINLSEKLILLEDYENIDDLFLAADIFLLPTYNKTFANSVLKAMSCKCAVFTTANNHSSELIDVFATMENPTDRSTPFKLDALLMQKEELNKVKKENRKIAKKFTLEKNFEKLKAIIQNV